MVQIKTDKHPKLIRLPEVMNRTGLGRHGYMSLLKRVAFPHR